MFGWLGDIIKGGAGMVGKGVSALGNLFGGGQGGGQVANPNAGFGSIKSTPVGFPQSGGLSMSPWSGAVGQGASTVGAPNGIGKLFSGNAGRMLGGLGMMGASQLIKNPSAPGLPDSYNQFMSQMNQGGTPGMQAANQYYMGVLSGNNKDAYDAAFHSLDLNYEEQLRQLNAMYKSLRPGTDPTSDSTYQRDLALLNDQYARQRAQVGAQVQQGAASGAAGLGAQQMGGQMAGIQAQIDQIANEWGMNASQKEALRNQFLGLGSSVMSNALDPMAGVYQKIFGRMFGG